MSARKKVVYPLYQFSESRGLFAFMSPKDMYRVLNVGSNSGNEGITIDHYITRKMVIKHMMGPEADITWQNAKEIYDRVFTAIRMKIIC